MISNSIDQQIKFHRFFWFSLIGLFAIVLGYFLASDLILMAFGLMGLIWMLTLPYHAKLSIYVSVATYSSALIVPLFPGRPYMWEFAALLGWSGLVILISMRQHSPDAWRLIRQNRWLYIGLVGYCLILVQIMFFRGVGFRILGSDQMGGRYYFQQFSCAILPFLFVFCRINERIITKLFMVQCLLTASYLVSDFVFSFAPGSLFFLLQFFELPGDAVNFEQRASNFGIRRVQSFFVVSMGFTYLMLVFFSLKEFVGRRFVYLIPAMIAVLGVGMLGGHRYLLLIVGSVLVVATIAQKFFEPRNLLITIAVTALVLSFTYAFVDRMPLAAQRALSPLPGLPIHPSAREDGAGTMETRRALIRIGLDMAPQYFWVGRGFGMSTIDYSYLWDPTVISAHVNQGRFFNGYVGLLVNTGIFGTIFMFMFLISGTIVAWKVVKHLRRYGCEDNFSRVCCVLAGLWIANFTAFIFFHGDSEYALKTFSLQAGLLVVCYDRLQKRIAGMENA